MAGNATTAVIIAGDFHRDIATRMIEHACAVLEAASVQVLDTIHVAGSYEVPLIADTALRTQKPDVVVVLGYIEKGETLHGEVMGYVVYEKLLQLQLEYKTPIGLGIIGPGATREQAAARVEATAKGAAEAALRTFTTLQAMTE